MIHLDKLRELAGYENGLERVNQAYDDWRSSMRGRLIAADDVGVFLDRIRMLWISVGISCGAEHELAEKVHAVIGEQLRRGALNLVSEMSAESSFEVAVRQTLTNFFQQLRFGHDVFPLEEVQKVAVLPDQLAKPSAPPSRRQRQKSGKQDKNLESTDKKTPDENVVSTALTKSASILNRLYARLLSPDPWGAE